ncbi:hypothetical protein DRF62_15740 [Chryseobacterium piscium]|uniref:M23ase beta-sheet core domain-containing protein n=1 Tax=Chryseobacterium piscium TaxID=333702 RepID=A0A3D9BGG1_9FLAO|nr:peptidoglycan DD-metalloendopeptidase family protein [Chryseobacterium piscium]REC52451.1 hypothetical protein DRF62_15740 [Chryseobacterium piscium]
MSKKGVSKISGNPSPKVGEAVTYIVTDWYPSTPQNQRNPANVIWELFKKRSNGRFTSTNIKKTGVGNFTFGEVAQKHTYRLEAYLFEPEGKGASTIEINPQPAAVPKIEKVELQYVDDSQGTVFSFIEKMRARAQCVNLNGEKLKFTLWEDDATGEGHDAKNLLIETKEATVDRSGVATAEFMLTRALMQKAMQGETDPKQLEFYVTVEYFSHNKHATDNVNVNNPLHTPAPTPQSRPQQPTNNAPTPPESTPETPSNNTQPRAENSPAAEKPASQMEERGVAGQNPNPSEGELHDYQEAQGTIEAEQPSTPQSNEGKTVSIVEDSSVEELLDAYFAKKEYTKQTGEAAGTLEYKFGSNGNKTATDAEKEKIAKIILGKPAVKALADKREYTTLEAIKQALSKEVYNKDEKVSFQTFKLGAELKKITSAPLDTKLYLVAKTAGSGLSDKQATIIIKEKDGLIKGSAGVVLPILEISEEQMDQATPTTGEVPGTEKSEFTGKIENGMVKIPVHLRPKSDDELKQWKEKVSRGKEDGEYTYKFGGENKVTDENSKKRVAEAILKNAKNGNTNNEKIADGKTAYIDDIEKALEIKTYQKDQTIKFKLYKKEKELLYLQAKAQGEKQHDKEFLKAEGAYFEIGKKCECEERIRAFMRVIRIAEGTGEYVKGTKTPRDPQLGYTTWFSGAGNNFTLSDDHPRVINSNSTNTLRSSAAGAYQFMSWKFDELNGKTVIFKNGYFQTAVPEIYTEASDKAKKYDAKGFEEIAQDRLCVIILKDIGAITKLLNDDIKGAISTSSGTWVSLPGATAGQPTAKMQETLDYYEEFLKEELAGNSHLHIQKGFLKDFDITCTCGNESSGSWRHPLDRMELRGWYNSGFYPGDSDHGDAEIRISKHHEGLDLYAPVGTQVYACVDGEIYEDYISGTYGNTLGIKGTYNGQTYYFFYAHLSERSVAKDAKVTAGDPIGKTGQSGNASGQAAKMDHLHFEVRTTSARTGGRIDPIATIDELKNDVITNPDQTTQTGI